jgi:hypothetical protein
VTLGKASIVTVGSAEVLKAIQPEAIVEVKVSVLLASCPKKVLMQMGIETVVWVLKCHQEHQQKGG